MNTESSPVPPGMNEFSSFLRVLSHVFLILATVLLLLILAYNAFVQCDSVAEVVLVIHLLALVLFIEWRAFIRPLLLSKQV